MLVQWKFKLQKCEKGYNVEYKNMFRACGSCARGDACCWLCLRAALTTLWRTFSPLATIATLRENWLHQSWKNREQFQTIRSLYWVLDKLVWHVPSAFWESLWLMSLLLWMFWKINSKEKWWTCSTGAYSFRHQKLWPTKVGSFHAWSEQIIHWYPHSLRKNRFSHPGESNVSSFLFPSRSSSSSETIIIVISVKPPPGALHIHSA